MRKTKFKYLSQIKAARSNTKIYRYVGNYRTITHSTENM